MIKQKRFEEFNAGDEIAVETDRLTRTDFVRYAGASGDFNPIHHDELYAVGKAKQPSVFAMGMFTAGLLSRLTSDLFGLGNVESFSVRFLDRVWPNDKLFLRCRIEEIDEAEKTVRALIWAENQNVKQVAKGEAKARYR
jgi:acyl dehydratase